MFWVKWGASAKVKWKNDKTVNIWASVTSSQGWWDVLTKHQTLIEEIDI